MKPTVGVVIVTYNRLNLLKIALDKVLSQTFFPTEVLIVNNDSTDGTRDYLDTLDNVSVLTLNENCGPAGGFHEGVKYFAENTNVDYVWLMDDDFFPFDSCLEILLDSTNEKTIVFPYIREKDFASRKQPGWWGVLVPMPIIKHVGYPRKDFFFWSEDTEYLLSRIREKFGYSGKWVSAAKGVHFTERKTNHRQSWRYYYEIRNMLYMRLYVRERTLKRYFKLTKSWAKLMGAILIKEDNKLEKLQLFSVGTIHGITKRMGKTIDPLSGKPVASVNYNNSPEIELRTKVSYSREYQLEESL